MIYEKSFRKINNQYLALTPLGSTLYTLSSSVLS